MSWVLFDVLCRDALDDENLQSTIKSIWNERTPYYCQITENGKLDQYARAAQSAQSSQTGQGQGETSDGDAANGERSTHVTRVHGGAHRGHRVVSVIASFDAEKKDMELDYMRRIPEFVHHVEAVLENTITNILVEAQRREFNPTSRPRLIALPPKTVLPSVTINSDA